MHGSSLAGKPVGIAQTAEISYIDEEGSKVKGVRALWAVSDEEGRMMRLEDMKLGYNFNQAFFEWIPDQIPIGIQTMSTSMSYQSNKGIFDMPMNVGTVMNRFGEPLKIQNLSSGAPELYILAKQNFIAPGLAMYYDELNTRFLLLLNGELYRFSDLDSRGNPAAIKPNGTNCNVLYMAKSGNFGYALMQDRAKPNRYLYKLNFNPFYNGSNYYSPIIENRNVSAGMKLYQAKVFGHNQDLAYLFYSTGSDLNMYDYDAGKENVNVVPVYDGQVTYIQHIDKYLIVATENAGRYKIYFYEMLAGRPDLSKDVKVVEGEGAVQGLTFAGLKK